MGLRWGRSRHRGLLRRRASNPHQGSINAIAKAALAQGVDQNATNGNLTTPTATSGTDVHQLQLKKGSGPS